VRNVRIKGVNLLGAILVLVMFVGLSFVVYGDSRDTDEPDLIPQNMTFTPASPFHFSQSVTVSADIYNLGICYIALGDNNDQVEYSFYVDSIISGFRIKARIRSSNGDTVVARVWIDSFGFGSFQTSSTTWEEKSNTWATVLGVNTHWLKVKLYSGGDGNTDLYVDWIQLLNAAGDTVLHHFEAEDCENGCNTVDKIYPQQITVQFFRGTTTGPQIGSDQIVGNAQKTIEGGQVDYITAGGYATASVIWPGGLTEKPPSMWYIYVKVLVTENEQVTNNNEDNELIEIYATLSITRNAAAGGGTNPAPGSYNYHGTVEAVTATANAGWVFDHWVLDGGGAGSSNPIQVTMNDDHDLEAVFNPKLIVTTVGSGSVNLNPSPGAQNDYPLNTVVTATATENANWHFSHWVLDGGGAGSSNPIQVTMDDHHDLQAVFSPDVGGIMVPIDRFGLLAPYIISTSIIVVTATAATIYVRRKFKRKKTKTT
jgi:hypothetical protein